MGQARSASCVVSLVAILGSPMAVAQPRDGGKGGKVWHVRVEGAIETGRMVRDIVAALDEARADGARLAIIEMSGQVVRIDHAWELAQRVRADEPRVAVLLDAGGTVGLDGLAIGALAESCWIEPGATCGGARGGPQGVSQESRERVCREFSGALYASFQERGLDTDLAWVLVEPTGGAWVVQGADGSPATIEPKDGPGGVPIVAIGPNGAAEVTLGADACERLGVAKVAGRGLGPLLAAEGIRGSKVVRRTISSGLARAAGSIENVLKNVDVALVEIDEVLDARARDRRVVTQEDRRDASVLALARIDEELEAVHHAEREFGEYPELLERPAPGTTAAAATEASRAKSWREAFEVRREKLDLDGSPQRPLKLLVQRQIAAVIEGSDGFSQGGHSQEGTLVVAPSMTGQYQKNTRLRRREYLLYVKYL